MILCYIVCLREYRWKAMTLSVIDSEHSVTSWSPKTCSQMLWVSTVYGNESVFSKHCWGATERLRIFFDWDGYRLGWKYQWWGLRCGVRKDGQDGTCGRVPFWMHEVQIAFETSKGACPAGDWTLKWCKLKSGLWAEDTVEGHGSERDHWGRGVERKVYSLGPMD